MIGLSTVESLKSDCLSDGNYGLDRETSGRRLCMILATAGRIAEVVQSRLQKRV